MDRGGRMNKRVSKIDISKNEFQKRIHSMAGKYSAYEIYMDWIESAALATQNTLSLFHDKNWLAREEKYFNIMKKYTHEERIELIEMLSYFCEELENNPRDVLGEAFMSGGMGADSAGQFFTPYHISQSMAELSLQNYNGGVIKINEPSCGSGGSIIALAMKLKEKGIDYQKVMKVVAQDLDWKCVYMCYLQLSYLGIDAICVQGNTLIEPFSKGYPEERVLRTPRNVGALL
jgi:type I restriction-modification system DNA methylase subunit